MRVVMSIDISGTRDDMPWPAKGQELDVSDTEGEQLVAQGYATLAESAPTEKAVATPRGERRTRKA